MSSKLYTTYKNILSFDLCAMHGMRCRCCSQKNVIFSEDARGIHHYINGLLYSCYMYVSVKSRLSLKI